MAKSGDYKDFYEQLKPIEHQKRGLNSDRDFDNTIRIIQNYLNEERIQLLDIGCGDGKYAERFKKCGHIVWGIDKFESQVCRAKPRIDVKAADAVKLPFADSTFDLCTVIMVIHLLNHEERMQAFKEVYRVLKPGGLLVIKTCSHNDLERRLSSELFPKTKEKDYERYPDIGQLETELNHLKKVNVQTVSETNIYTKEELANIYYDRQSSNMWLLDDEALNDGIEFLYKKYKDNEKIIRATYNTFLTYAKE